jgi:diguanylate cyclase (GGDEF)-like protein
MLFMCLFVQSSDAFASLQVASDAASSSSEQAYRRIQFAPREVRLLALSKLESLAAGDPSRVDWLAVAGEVACTLSLQAETDKWSTEGLSYSNLSRLQLHRLSIAKACAASNVEAMPAMLAMLDRLVKATPPTDGTRLADIYGARAALYNSANRYADALAELHKALPLAPLSDARTIRSDVLTSIGYIHHQSNSLDNAERHFREAIAQAQQQPLSVRLSTVQFRLASVLIRRGERTEEAKSLLKMSGEVAQEIGDTQGVGYANYGLGMLLLRHHEANAARHVLGAARKIFRHAGDVETTGWIDMYLARAVIESRQYRVAQQFADEAVAAGRALKDQSLERAALKERSNAHAALGEYQAAYQDLLASNRLFERIVERQQAQTAQDFQTRFDHQKQAQDLTILKQRSALQQAQLKTQQQQNLIVLAAAAALSVALIAVLLGKKQRDRHNAILQAMADTDVLTGLANRRSLMERLAAELKRAQRHELSLALALIDIDFFKAVNDNYGHGAGDELLREWARCAQLAMRVEDILARFGGEEFVLVMPHTDQVGALAVIDRVRKEILEMTCPLLNGGPLPTFSAGLAVLADADESVDHLLERADAALYEAKRRGRNRTEVADRSRGRTTSADGSCAQI